MNIRVIGNSAWMLLLGAVLACICDLSARAQGAQRSTVPTAAFQQKLAQLNSQLQTVEQRFGAGARRIESSARIGVQDLQAPDIEQAMEGYTETLKVLTEEALADAERAAKSQGREGDARKLALLETMVKSHEGRTALLRNRADRLYAQVKSGQVVLDRAVLEQLSPAERQEFGDFVSTTARKRYPAELVPGSRATLELPQLGKLADSLFQTARSRINLAACADWILDSIVTPAHPAMLAGCAGACTYAWPSCIACVGLATGLTVQSWSIFRNCWNGSGKPRWTPLWLYRTYCVSALVAIVG